MRNLFTCAIIRVKNNITNGKTVYVISYYIPDRTEGFCVVDCEKGVKFRTLYPRRFFLLSPFDSGKGLEFLDFRIPLSVSRNTGAHLKYRLGTAFPG